MLRHGADLLNRRLMKEDFNRLTLAIQSDYDYKMPYEKEEAKKSMFMPPMTKSWSESESANSFRDWNDIDNSKKW